MAKQLHAPRGADIGKSPSLNDFVEAVVFHHFVFCYFGERCLFLRGEVGPFVCAGYLFKKVILFWTDDCYEWEARQPISILMLSSGPVE